VAVRVEVAVGMGVGVLVGVGEWVAVVCGVHVGVILAQPTTSPRINSGTRTRRAARTAQVRERVSVWRMGQRVAQSAFCSKSCEAAARQRFAPRSEGGYTS
jgi:hypothetical protein